MQAAPTTSSPTSSPTTASPTVPTCAPTGTESPTAYPTTASPTGSPITASPTRNPTINSACAALCDVLRSNCVSPRRQCDDDTASLLAKYDAVRVTCTKYQKMGLCDMVHRSSEPWCNRTCGYCPRMPPPTCVCHPGYETHNNGKICTPIRECASSPCMNGATCTEGACSYEACVGGYSCSCSRGWFGEHCNIRTAEPTTAPTRSPTTHAPTSSPTLSPSKGPTSSPTLGPTASPTVVPSAWPTSIPSMTPTLLPTNPSLANEWATIPSLQIPRSEHSIAEVDGKLYALGGLGSGAGQYLSSVETLDISAGAGVSWTIGVSLPEPNYAFASLGLHKKVWILGGMSGHAGHPSSQRAVRDVHQFNTTAKRWVAAPSLLVARYGLGAVAANGTIYVFGGRGSGSQFLARRTASLAGCTVAGTFVLNYSLEMIDGLARVG